MKILSLLLSFFTFHSLIFGASQKPNVLLISIDDLNDWVGCMGGHPQAKTPNIDRVAKMGTLFNNAHCQSPVCNPSRASMMTGRYPHTSGVYFLSPDLKEAPVLKNLKTMPEVFADHGYKTMAAGKIYHRGDKRFFRNISQPVDLGLAPRKKFPNRTDIRYGTGEFFRMMTI